LRVSRPRTIDVLDKVVDGRYRVSRDGAALCERMGEPEPAEALRKACELLGVHRRSRAIANHDELAAAILALAVAVDRLTASIASIE
jgi:hypothetical protein